MADQAGYKNIFKTTFLFGFVQVFNIAVKVGLNKTVALLLGPAGMGIISLYNNSIQLLSTGAGLGISQSAVRDIAEASGTGHAQQLNITISFVKRIIRYTSLLGIVLMSALSPLLSEWTFGSTEYTIAYLLLSLAVGATIQTNGYRAINTGMRELRYVAYSTMFGAVAGLITALPSYFFLGEKGIVPSLIISSVATLLIAKYYADRVKYTKVKMSMSEALTKSSNTIKMGISLMIMSFMFTAVQLIISSYISGHGGLKILGLYQAGATVVTSYFGIIVTAMSTEYYPRISSFNQNNTKLNDAVNAQSEIGLLLALPLLVLFVFLSPYFIKFLYTGDFINATDYLDFAVLGTVTIICSNSMGMILLAKQASKLFLYSTFLCNVLVLAFTISLYEILGLTGLGVAYALNGFMQFVMYDFIMWRCYRIRFNKFIILFLFGIFFCCGLASFSRSIDIVWLKWATGSGLFLATTIYSIKMLNQRMNINLVAQALKLFKHK